MVTVTTNMAGRGTDIKLDAAAAAAGGLHVVVAQCNRARRIDRQLLGRSARQGDPGSAECIAALDDPLPAATWPAWVLRVACGCASAGLVPRWLARPLLALPQRRAEWHDLFLRRALRAADRQTRDDLGFAGLQE